MIRKFTFLKYSFFENVLLLSISRNSLQKPSSYDIVLETFTLSNLFILVKELICWKRGFDLFLIDNYTGDIGNKNITDPCISATNWVKSYWVLYLKFLST